ncbi:adenylate kinase [Amycolatopsis taiwanensis]|uniref:adenylate kinase n=1 Tax=Amycolatopsis taiwanensis TaxID=342230 RepID=UPI0004B5B421|nr:adenylate kinase [Amycolatopsis taiwanensis]
MRKVVVLGRGGAGKSTLAARLGAAPALPVIELDEHFWTPGLTPAPKDRWAAIQRRLTSGERWILDGDLGPYDVLSVRLQAADAVIVLDFPLWRCVWRTLHRSRENLAFWRWLVTYRRRSLPTIMTAIAEHAGHAKLFLLRNPNAVEQLLVETVNRSRPPAP